MSELQQIFNTVNIGLVILDTELKVRLWNRWMSLQSGVAEESIVGTPLFDTFPSLNNQRFLRNCKSVLTFGNFIFFSQKLHGYLFPFKAPHSIESRFEFMQQSCTMGPIRGEGGKVDSLFLFIQDVTELATYERKLLETNMRDGLTGIYNRRHLDRRLSEEFERSRRYGRSFSLIVCDIDFFKKVNDTYGHNCGDFILKSVAEAIGSSIRKTDCFARFGGEEFCCLLPETDLESAMIVAEKFRCEVEGLDNEFQGANVKVTISLGVSEQRESMPTPESLFVKADQALYRAKQTGRNRAVSMLEVEEDPVQQHP